MAELASVPDLTPDVTPDLTPDHPRSDEGNPSNLSSADGAKADDLTNTAPSRRITQQDAREAEALHDAAGDRSLAAAQRLMSELAGSLEGVDDLAPYLDRLVAA